MSIPDKLYFRLGEVVGLTGFSKRAILKLKEAGTLKPVRLRGYGWECYPREQVVKLSEPVNNKTTK